MHIHQPSHIIKLTFPLVILLTLLLLPESLFTARAQEESRTWLPLVTRSLAQNKVHTGVATVYDANGDGGCMFGPSPDDLMVGALNEYDYGQANYCGAYVHISGPKGDIVVRIVDICPGCRVGLIDLSPQAFIQLNDLNAAYTPISWHVISPDIDGPISYFFKRGSSQWWTAVQVRNHRNPITKFEYRNSRGVWVNVKRALYNYFIEPEGMGPGPYTFRVTDMYGNTLVDTNIPHVEEGAVQGARQFPYGP